MTEPLPPYQPPYQPPAYPPPPPRPPRGLPTWAKGLAVTLATLVLVGTGVGVGMAATANSGASGEMSMGGSTPPATSGTTAPKARPGAAKAHKAHKGTGAQPKIDPARQAWAHKYGVDRSTMPNLAPTAGATDAQKAAATDLLERTEAATAKYSDLSVAKSAGFDLAASLARAEKKTPRIAANMKKIDAGMTSSRMPMVMLHVGNAANRSDGKVLDPNAPETLMYQYTGNGNWKLIGVMYTANESYPAPPPDPGGPITRWHYHDKSGGEHLMMHIFFVPGNDLAHAYAAEMT